MVARWLKWIALLTLLLLVPACDDTGGEDGGGGGGGPVDKPHSTGGSTWTVLVYMVADNDLEPFALQDLEEMMQVGSNANFNLVVQVDRADGYANDPIGGLGDFTGTKRVIVRNGSLEQLSELGELDMADPATLSDFVTWGLKTYPADRTALVFWDHGGGWLGFGVDEASGGKLLHLPDIEAGVKNGLAGAGNAKPFSFIGFDACLMATWEVSATLAPYSEYLLASEETEPGHGWDWRSWSVAADNPSAEPLTVGKALIDGFKAQAIEKETVDNITLSFIDLYRLGTLQTAMTALTKTFDGTATLATAFGRGQEQSLKFGDAPDPSRAMHLVDLADLSTKVANETSTAAAAKDSMLAAVNNAVLYHVEGAARANGRGMAVYFPPDSSYYAASYDQLSTAIDTWRGFLKAYFGGAATTAVPTFTNANKVAVTSIAASGLSVSGTLASDGANAVTRATLLEGIESSGTYIILGDEPASLSGTSVSGTWDLTALSISRGSDTGFGYSSFESVGSGKYALTILFAYRKTPSATAQTCLRQIVFTESGGSVTITSDTYYVDSNGALGELAPVAGSTLMPLLKTIDPATGNEALAEGATTAFATSTDANGKPTFDDLKLEYRKLNSGVKVLGVLTVENAAGKGDAVIGLETVP